MRGKRILALLCAASLCCMSLSCAAPTRGLAEGEVVQAAEEEARRQAEEEARKRAEAEAAKKAEEEAAAKRAAEEEARKRAEAEAAKKAEEEAAAKRAAEEEARRQAEAEAAKKAEEEAAAKKAAEEEARRQEEAEAAKKAEEEAAAKKAEEEAAAAKKAEEEAAAKKAEEEAAAAQKAEEEAAAAKKAEEEAAAAKKAEEEAAAAQKAEEEAAAAKKAEEEAAAAQKAEEEAAAAQKAEEEAAAANPPAEAPTEAPTPVPTEAPTEAPTEVPAPDEGVDLPTETKGEVKLSNLEVSKKEIKPGRKLVFTYKLENADKVTWKAVRSDGVKGGSGETTGDSFTWRPKKSGIYTVTVKATDGEITKTKKCTVTVTSGKLAAKAKAPTGYAVVGKSDLAYDIGVTGGCEPYTINITIEYKGDTIFMSDELEDRVTCPPAGYGKHYLYLEVIDATGATSKAKALVRASTTETNDPPSLPRLNAKMTFAERLVAVAASQVGYHEVEENFILDADQKPQNWSYYGAWYGMPYEEWCVMFVMYCLNKAGVGGMLGVYANTNRWRVALGSSYDDNEDEFIPEAGDIIYFHHDRVSDDPNFPNHVGIVTGYDPDKDVVYTVEGNTGMAVRAKQYTRDDPCIVGYLSLRKYMRRLDKAYRLRVDTARAEERSRLVNRGKDVAIQFE